MLECFALSFLEAPQYEAKIDQTRAADTAQSHGFRAKNHAILAATLVALMYMAEQMKTVCPHAATKDWLD